MGIDYAQRDNRIPSGGKRFYRSPARLLQLILLVGLTYGIYEYFGSQQSDALIVDGGDEQEKPASLDINHTGLATSYGYHPAEESVVAALPEVREEEPKPERHYTYSPSEEIQEYFTKTRLNAYEDANEGRTATTALVRRKDTKEGGSAGSPSGKAEPSLNLYPPVTIPIRLLNGIISRNPAPVIAQVRHPVYTDNQQIAIAPGSKVIGTVTQTVEYGDEKINVSWTTLVLPNKRSVNLRDAASVDSGGFGGLPGDVDNRWGEVIAASVFTSILGAGAQVANRGTVDLRNQSIDDAFWSGMGSNGNRAGQQIIQRELNVQPTILVEPGTEGTIIVTQPLKIPLMR
jgi:type IV secretory pathway VirB10-like protein